MANAVDREGPTSSELCARSDSVVALFCEVPGGRANSAEIATAGCYGAGRAMSSGPRRPSFMRGHCVHHNVSRSGHVVLVQTPEMFNATVSPGQA